MEAHQRVVIIQDASREVCSSAIRWALQGLSLKPGDMLTVLGVLHRVNAPCTLSFTGSRNPLGYKSRVDSAMFGANQKVVEREAARKKQEYEDNLELIQISKLYETHKVEFKIVVATGASPKEVAVKNAQELKATWVILDRQMKKERRCYMDQLSCGISRMKRNGRIEKLRGPKAKRHNNLPLEENNNIQVTYDEMVQGTPGDDELFSIEFHPEIQAEAHQESEVEEPTKSTNLKEVQEGLQDEKIFQGSACTICRNIRPSFEWSKDFTYAELRAATDGFSAKNFVSEGGAGFGFVGQLENNLKIVVKQRKHTSPQGEEDFNLEVSLLKKARHENLVMLLGSCTEGSLRLLVYEYACNGSAEQHLSKSCPLPLTWKERVKVAVGTARGLNYLHENNIIHGVITRSNILLTHDFEPLLGDFRLSKDEQGHSLDHGVLENLIYLAPEYAESRKLSTKTDVYAFGIVLLELITGQKAEDNIQGRKRLVPWARPLLKERRHLEIVDHRLASCHDAEQLHWMARVAQKCLNKVPEKRLTMNQVISALECMVDRKTCRVIEDISAVRSYLRRSTSYINGFRSFDRTSDVRASLSREVDAESQGSRSFSLNSSSTISTARRSTSISRTSTSSITTCDRQRRPKFGNRSSVYYGEMLN